MDNRIYLINLYDYYSELLTEKQREYFEDYYFDNLTLQEISENNDVSRNAVHKQLKETEEKLKQAYIDYYINKKDGSNEKDARKITFEKMFFDWVEYQEHPPTM